MKIRVELPATRELSSVFNKLQGWFLWTGTIPPVVSLRVNGREVKHSLQQRLDVEHVKKVPALGFTAVIDTHDISGGVVDVQVSVGADSTSIKFQLTDEARREAREWAARKQRKLARLAPHLQCPVCGGSPVGEDLRCAACGAAFHKVNDCYNMLPAALAGVYKIDPTENVSHHPYAPEAQKLISEVKDRGGLILDCGSGFRFAIDEDIVCLEVVDYPSTDVVAVGQSLPFRDNTFDLVHSSAVLEHVTDPFRCAAELLRVCKPDGRIYCAVPFLQPEHGYPHHYYNMTQAGLVHLFGDAIAVEQQGVPAWGHPLSGLAWFLNEYERHLPAEHRERYRAMTVQDLTRIHRTPDDPVFATLSEDGRRVLASITCLVARKLG